MEHFMIETPIGWCRCVEINGIYHPTTEADVAKFTGEEVLNIEKIYEGERDASV
jgi:hypothetical protein